MKVCMLTSSFPRFEGDHAGVFVYHLVSHLTRKGVDVEVLCPHEYGLKHTEIVGDITVRRFPYFYPLKYQRLCYGSGIPENMGRSLLEICQIPFFVLSGILYSLWRSGITRPDIVHAHWTLPQGLAGILCKSFLRIPCVTSIHGSDVNSLKHPLFRAMNKLVLSLSDVCTANSSANADEAVNISGRKNIKIIPMGVDTDFISETLENSSVKEQYNIDGKIILFAGRLIDLKGVNFLIKAMPKVLETYADAKLFIIGSGPLKDRLMDLAKGLGLADIVTFIDLVTQDELKKFYLLSDVFVLPSIINEKGETEGLGVVMLEAMAAGLPVVGSKVGGIPDIIQDGKTGMLSKQKDPESIAAKIITLLSDEVLRKRIRENGMRLIEKKFSWERIAKEFMDVYHGVLR